MENNKKEVVEKEEIAKKEEEVAKEETNLEENKEEIKEEDNNLEEIENLKKELEELRGYKNDNETKQFLMKNGVKEQARKYVSQLLSTSEDKEKGIEILKKDLPELFESKAIKPSADFSKESGKVDSSKDELKELDEMKKKIGG